jgi:hypothetical protein
MSNNPIPRIVSTRVLTRLRAAGVLNETALRNITIRTHYLKLRTRGMRVVDAILILSDRYNLSYESIRRIIYSRLPLV